MARRIVRKQPLWQKIKSSPLDLLLAVNESLELIDWDSLAYEIALPLGAVLCLLLVMCKFYFLCSNPQNTLFGVPYFAVKVPSLIRSHSNDIFIDQASEKWSFMAFVVSTLALFIFSISFGNAIYLLREHRDYTLMARAVDNPPATKSAFKIKYSEPRELDQVPDFGTPMKRIVDGIATAITPLRGVSSADTSAASSTVASSTNRPSKRAWNRRAIDELPSTPVKQQAKQMNTLSCFNSEELWQLRIWNPSMFNLTLCVSLSPAHVVTIWLAPITISSVIAIAFMSGWLFVLTSQFKQLLKDQQIVHGEVVSEYSKQMVQPSTTTLKRDVAVGTDGTVTAYHPTSSIPTRLFSKREVRASHSRASLVGTDFGSRSPSSSPMMKRQFD